MSAVFFGVLRLRSSKLLSARAWYCCRQVNVLDTDLVSSVLERAIENPLSGIFSPSDGPNAPFELAITDGTDLVGTIERLELARDQYNVDDPCYTVVSVLWELYKQVENGDFEGAVFPTEAIFTKNAMKCLGGGCAVNQGDIIVEKDVARGNWKEVPGFLEKTSKNIPAIVVVVHITKDLTNRLDMIDVTPRRDHKAAAARGVGGGRGRVAAADPKAVAAGGGGGGRRGGAAAGGFASDDDDDDDDDDENENENDDAAAAAMFALEGVQQGSKNAADEDDEGTFAVGNVGASETPLPAAKSASRLTPHTDPQATAAADPSPAPSANIRPKRNAPKKYRE